MKPVERLLRIFVKVGQSLTSVEFAFVVYVSIPDNDCKIGGQVKMATIPQSRSEIKMGAKKHKMTCGYIKLPKALTNILGMLLGDIDLAFFTAFRFCV